MAPTVGLFYAMVEENYLRLRAGVEGLSKEEIQNDCVKEDAEQASFSYCVDRIDKKK
ncbi:hypothetical protein [Bacillus sp. JCM 19041]|uniref:hypothetical protein n=1 Tax=Bacillus sp. JCM 19041 TaxID=1460637 RepID=UPI000AE75DAF